MAAPSARAQRAQRDHLCALLDGDDRWRFTRPPGGLALWLRLSAISADTVVRRANEHGIALVAGPSFAADATLTHYLRLPFTPPPPPVLDRVAAVLGDACAQGHGPP
ncbi:hypothetical protein [Nonomuraea sp. NPDC050643]|uniref:hypothetical protein n=1 Tax=Nonomuraea sp. NPDC050643 TaxID=3155660 RepID=UPI0033F3E249